MKNPIVDYEERYEKARFCSDLLIKAYDTAKEHASMEDFIRGLGAFILSIAEMQDDPKGALEELIGLVGYLAHKNPLTRDFQ